MPEQTYLELSESGGGAHKFYEVTTDGTTVTVRYGRIGTQGQTTVSDFPTSAKAQAAAAKKVQAKVRKGYATAVRGARKRRAVIRRPLPSAPPTPASAPVAGSVRAGVRGTAPVAHTAPVLWRLATGSPAFGIYVDDEHCWVGNQDGGVYKVTHDGVVTERMALPDGVKCLVGDDFWLYAGCDDGMVYDLGGKVPRVAYEIAEDIDIYWLDVHDAVLGVSDAQGRITAIDYEDECQWSRMVGGNAAWMVRCDDDAVYHGHSHGVGRYDAADGAQVWHASVAGAVLFGWQEADSVYAATTGNGVTRLAKADGRVEAVYRCDRTVYSCATAPGGRYVFAGDNTSSIYCFAENGERLWKLRTGCGSALSMQYLDERLYIVTSTGVLACVDAGEEAIAAARRGSVPRPVDVKAAAALTVVRPGAAMETVADAGDGVIVECFSDGARLRVRVLSEGYDASWNVQFPKDVREAGARYRVDGVRRSGRGRFYRAYGEIKRLL